MGNPGPQGTASNSKPMDAGTLAQTTNVPSAPTGSSAELTAPRLPVLASVYVVKLGMTRLENSLIQDACGVVKQELESVFKDENGKLTGVFSIAQGAPEGGRRFGASEYGVYLLRKMDEDQVKVVLSRQSDFTGKDLNALVSNIVKQVRDEGGACPSDKVARHACFVTLDKFEEEAAAVPESDDEASARETRVAAYLGEMMLHELGHAMGAKHDSGIMKKVLAIRTTDMPDDPHFSMLSKSEIRKTFGYSPFARKQLEKQLPGKKHPTRH